MLSSCVSHMQTKSLFCPLINKTFSNYSSRRRVAQAFGLQATGSYKDRYRLDGTNPHSSISVYFLVNKRSYLTQTLAKNYVPVCCIQCHKSFKFRRFFSDPKYKMDGESPLESACVSDPSEMPQSLKGDKKTRKALEEQDIGYIPLDSSSTEEHHDQSMFILDYSRSEITIDFENNLSDSSEGLSILEEKKSKMLDKIPQRKRNKSFQFSDQDSLLEKTTNNKKKVKKHRKHNTSSSSGGSSKTFDGSDVINCGGIKKNNLNVVSCGGKKKNKKANSIECIDLYLESHVLDSDVEVATFLPDDKKFKSKKNILKDKNIKSSKFLNKIDDNIFPKHKRNYKSSSASTSKSSGARKTADICSSDDDISYMDINERLKENSFTERVKENSSNERLKENSFNERLEERSSGSELEEWIDLCLEEPINKCNAKQKSKTKEETTKDPPTSILDEIIEIARVLPKNDSSPDEIEEIVMDSNDYSDPADMEGSESQQCPKETVESDIEEDSDKDPEDAEDIFKIQESDSESLSSKESSSIVELNLEEEYVPLSSPDLHSLDNPNVLISDIVYKKRMKMEKQRKWERNESSNSHKKTSSTDVRFTVLSYNVLAQKLLTDNMFLYQECNPEYLDWNYRWPLIQHEVKLIDPEIITLQEVQATHYHTHYQPWFKHHNYECLFKKRTGQRVDGCAIFYNSSKFRLLEHTNVEYFQPKAKRVLDRDNVAIIAKFVPVDNEKSPFCVATTHLLYNPKRHDVKLAQVSLLLTELDRICYKGEKNGRPVYCPAILTGDMNVEPQSSLINFIKEGYIHYEHLNHKTLTEQFRNNSYPLGFELLPSCLGITPYCQHKMLSDGRYLENMRGSLFSLTDKRKIEQSLILIDNSDWKKESDQQGQPKTSTARLGNGHLYHNFHFGSVYRHFVNRYRNAPEVTADQNDWCTVDYMFYTQNLAGRGRLVEGDLKLHSRYGLLTKNEAERFAPMPNEIIPSDHYPLAARFLLKRAP